MNKKFKRAISSMLAFIMILSSMFMNVSGVYAADASDYTYALDFTTASEAPAADSTADLVDADGNAGMTVQFLGNWKVNGGYAPADNSDRPTVSGGLYSAGCALRFTPDTSGSVIVSYKLGNGKTLVFEDTTNGAVHKSFANSSGSTVTTNTADYAVDVVAGTTYTVYVTGTGNQYYGIYFEPASTGSSSLVVKDLATGTDIASYTVTDSTGNEIEANEDGTYTLTSTSTYTVSADGYVSADFTPSSESVEISLAPIYNVAITETNGATITVTDADGAEVTATEGLYSLIYNETYTISADGYASEEITVTSGSDIELTLTAVDKSNPESFAYWFDTAESLSAGKYYLAGGEVELFDTFVAARGYTFTDSEGVTHTSYQGTTNKATLSGYIPTAGNAYSFTPWADGKVKFYGATASGKTFSISVQEAGATSATETRYEITDASEPVELSVVAGNTYYVYGNSSTGNSAFVGFDYIKAEKLTIAGTVTLVDADGYSAPTEIYFTADGASAITATVTDGAFSVELEAGVEYDITTDSNELMITSDQTITATTTLRDSGLAITMTIASEETVTGTVYGLDDPSSITITFTKGDIVATATVQTDGTYAVNLEPGTYTVTLPEVDGYTISSLSADDYTVTQGIINTRNVLYTKPATAVTSTDIYVDKSATPDTNTFNSIREAMAAIDVSSLDSYTVHITPDTYEEQVIVKASNVTFTTDGQGDATITWYYGFGSEYYSVNPSTGRYDEEYALLKVSKDDPALSNSKWAATVIVEGSNFYAENIIFKNSYNFEITDAEIADGVGPATTPAQGSAIDRTVDGFDPKSKAATERAAAICLPTTKATFYQCQFLSSQDTFIPNNGAGKYYVNDSVIVGQTDYICGAGNLIIDNSQLLWKGYSDTLAAGYITAAQGNFLLRDCTIGNYEDSDVQFKAGYFGRPWNAGSKVIFKDCTEDGEVIDYTDCLVTDGVYTGWSTAELNTTADKELMYNCTTTGEIDGTATITSQYCTMSGGTELTITDLLGYTYLTEEPTNYAYDDFDGAPVVTEYAFANNSSFSSAAAYDDGVLELSGYSYNDSQQPHGIVVSDSTTMNITVDGPKSIYLGGCSYSGGSATVTVTDSDGNTYTTANTKTSACYCNDTTQLITLEYPTDAATTLTLTFSGTSYLPYLKIADYVEVTKYTVSGSIVDEDGTAVSGATVTASAGDLTVDGSTYTIANVPEGTSLTIAVSCDGYSSTSTTVTVDGDITKHIVLSGIAEVTLPVTYDFRTDSNFTGGVDYVDSLLSLSGYSYNGSQHGIQTASSTVMTLDVDGSVSVTISQCQYGGGTLTVTDSDGNVIVDGVSIVATTDGDTYTFDYVGDATTLTFTLTYGFIHYMTVEEGEASEETTEGTTEGTTEENTEETTTTVVNWDFQNANPSSITSVALQGSTGTVASDVDGINLYVDATSGKLAYNSAGYAQFNSGTIIQVPVYAEGDVVTVVSYPNQYNYTVAGTAATDNTTTYTATADDVATGYVEVVATSTSYLYSISLATSYVYVAPVVYEYIFTDSTYSETPAIDDGVLTLSGYSYNGNQHGIYGVSTMQIAVDGAKSIYLGGCSYSGSSSTVTLTDADGNTYTTANTKTSACYCNDTTQLITLEYPVDTATTLTLTFSGTTYIPYMKIADYVEVTRYTVSGSIVDEDGNAVSGAAVTASAGNLTVDGSTYTITDVPEGTELTIAVSCDGYSSTSTTVTVDGDITKHIVLSGIAEVTLPVSYDFRTESNFTNGVAYVDSLLSLSGYSYHGTQHGIVVNSNTAMTLDVDGSVSVTISQCQYGGATLTVTDSDGNVIVDGVSIVATTDGDTYTFDYVGDATTLTFAFTSGYIHCMAVEEGETSEETTEATTEETTETTTEETTEGETVVYEYIFTDSVYSETPAIDDGVLTLSGYSYNGNQHGIYGVSTMQIAVDGAKSIYLGGCQYSGSSSTVTLTDADGNTYTTANTKTSACYYNDKTQLITLEYPVDTATTLTLTFSGTTYIPYMKIADYVEVTRYTVSGSIVDEDGNAVSGATVTASAGDVTVDGSTYTVANVPEGTELTIGVSCDGYSSTSETIIVNVDINHDITLSGIVEVTLPVAYDFRTESNFTNGIAYVDSLLSLSGYTYNGTQHGIAVNKNTSMTLDVNTSVTITLTQCQYGSGHTFTVTDANGNVVVDATSMAASACDETYTFDYVGNATTLTFTFTGGYIHCMTVEKYVANEFLFDQFIAVDTTVYVIGKIMASDAEDVAKISEVGFILSKTSDNSTSEVSAKLSTTTVYDALVCNGETISEDGYLFAGWKLINVDDSFDATPYTTVNSQISYSSESYTYSN